MPVVRPGFVALAGNVQPLFWPPQRDENNAQISLCSLDRRRPDGTYLVFFLGRNAQVLKQGARAQTQSHTSFVGVRRESRVLVKYHIKGT